MPEINVKVTEDQYEYIREVALNNGLSVEQYAGNLMDRGLQQETSEDSFVVSQLFIEDVKSWIDDHHEIGPQLTIKLRAMLGEPLVKKGHSLYCAAWYANNDLPEEYGDRCVLEMDSLSDANYDVVRRLVEHFPEFAEKDGRELVATQTIYESDLPN